MPTTGAFGLVTAFEPSEASPNEITESGAGESVPSWGDSIDVAETARTETPEIDITVITSREANIGILDDRDSLSFHTAFTLGDSIQAIRQRLGVKQ
jgi:hypothetical protein